MDLPSSTWNLPDVLVRGVLSPWTLGVVLLCAAAVGLEVLLRHRWSRHFHHACRLWTLGLLETAERHFRLAARWSYGSRQAAALAWVGLCQRYQGEYAAAVATFEPLLGRRMPRSMGVFHHALPGYLSLCLAMLGETRRAKRWLEEAFRRCEGTTSTTWLLLPEAVLLCREGRFGAALKKLEDGWPVMVFEGTLCHQTRLFKAFARQGLDPERYERDFAPELLALTPFSRKELAFCDEHWPELADFMWAGEELAKQWGMRRGWGRKKGTPEPDETLH
jgi:tetratricopeptide (TPR) repeat protein